MNKITLLFTRRNAIGSYALRTFLWSQWSHVVFVDGDEIIEAAAGVGVRVRKKADLIAEVSKYEEVTFHTDKADEIIRHARSQVGKKYDWLGALGIAFHSNWDKKNRWFCSELVAWAFAEAGVPLMRKSAWRVTPQDLYEPIWNT